MEERFDDMRKTFGCADKTQAYELQKFLTSFGYTADVEFTFGYTADVEFSGIKWYITTDGYEMVERMFKNYMN